MAWSFLPTPPSVRLAAPAHDPPQAIKPVGTHVERGESICQDDSASSLGLLASVSGTISHVDSTVDAQHREWLTVEISASRPGEIVKIIPAAPTPAEIERITLDIAAQSASDFPGWIERFRRCGISARRIGAPDLQGQLFQALRRPIDTVLCNLLDGDPGVSLNAQLVQERAGDISAAVGLLGKLAGAGQMWAVIDAAAPSSVFAALQSSLRKFGIKLIRLQNDYPQADPTLLLYELLGRRLRPGRLPTEQGVLLFDAPAAAAMGAQISRNEPMLLIPLAVRDHAKSVTHFLLVPCGTSVKDVLAYLKIDPHARTLRQGDLLRDRPIADTDCFSDGESVLQISPLFIYKNPDPCLRCGWCVDACPTRIHPAGLLDAAQRNDAASAERFGSESCIDCGICSFVCPSRLPLLNAIRQLKAQTH